MIENHIKYIGPYQCKYVFDGDNLAELRRAVIRKLVMLFGLPGANQASKNEMLTVLIAYLDAEQADENIDDMVRAKMDQAKPDEDEEEKEEKPAKKKSKKKSKKK